MKGNIALVARIGLYAVAGSIADSAGFATFDPEAGRLILELDGMAQAAGAAGVVFLGLAWRKWAVLSGGKT
ncbi:hypothetical protein ATO8_19969 [Roseivivax marinus]|uniref:Uncharacterized protein n=1 Tax=Roseivivax marinus TaxID=1379903 RepID=W4HDY3_9RHOB|nr:hypothetical protein [Roseivivax marinus]ETW10909.1 hypothetical protein ATO8_19969 [Roseivivax marinus]